MVEKKYFTELKIRYIKFQNYAFMEIKKYLMKTQNQYEERRLLFVWKFEMLSFEHFLLYINMLLQ